MNGPGGSGGHVFISYVREDAQRVDWLQAILEDAGVEVWRDTADLWPGQDWRSMIRHAITDGALVFLACFSGNSVNRVTTYQNEELTLAVEQLRLRRPDEPWLIPVRFDDCKIPDRDLGGGRTLASIQRADLFGEGTESAAIRLVKSILRILGPGVRSAGPAGPADRHSPTVEVSIASPDASDAGLQVPVRSVVVVKAGGERISRVDASYVTDPDRGGTTSTGYAPLQVSTNAWRIRSVHQMRSLRDVIIGYTVKSADGDVRRFQWDGFDHEYDWTPPGADGSHLSALLQIRKLLASPSAVQQATDSLPPAASWQSDSETFDRWVTDGFRLDDIPLRQMLFDAHRQARSLLADRDFTALDTLLDRLASIGALAIQFGRAWWLQRVLKTLVAIYELGFDPAGYEKSDPAFAQLWFALAARIHALGGLAVRLRDWPAVRALATQSPDSDSLRHDFGSWLQHAPVMAARANLLDPPGEKEAGMISKAVRVARTVSSLHPDRGPDDEAVVSSICQFDVLACLAVIDNRQNLAPGNFFPSFIRYRSRRAEPAFREIVSDPEIRRAIFRGDDQLLADALGELLRYANMQSFWHPAWDGMNDPIARRFITDHRTSAPNVNSSAS